MAWRMQAVVRKFKDGKGINREELACGHVVTDKDVLYDNELAVRIKAAGKALTGNLGRRRCYKCAKEA
jgi:hypothetical protein